MHVRAVRIFARANAMLRSFPAMHAAAPANVELVAEHVSTNRFGASHCLLGELIDLHSHGAT